LGKRGESKGQVGEKTGQKIGKFFSKNSHEGKRYERLK